MYIILLGINFVIAWHNAIVVGRMWSESRLIGGQMRALAVAGYALSITGFTMVYGCLLLRVAPYILPLFLPRVRVDGIISLSADMIYVLVGMCILPSGLIVWFNSVVSFWRRKTLGTASAAAWNTYAQSRNAVYAARHMPAAFGRIRRTIFRGNSRRRGRKKADGELILFAILVIVLAVCGGWFTASKILKVADRDYDGFADLMPM
jgi:hypothetical protein